MKSPFAGVTAVYALRDSKSSTCTIVLPMVAPRKNDQVITKSDSVVVDGVGETGIFPRYDFHGELAFRKNGDRRCERMKRDLQHETNAQSEVARGPTCGLSRKATPRRDDASRYCCVSRAMTCCVRPRARSFGVWPW